MPAGTAFRGRAVGGGPVDAVEARRALALLADPRHGCEVFALPAARSLTLPGSDLDGLVRWVERHGGGMGCFVTLNPVRPGLDRAPHVGDIFSRQRLLIDVDARREDAGRTNATEAEHEAAREAAAAVLDYLAGKDWPAPLLLDSGNGFQLVYGVDLPNDALGRALVRGLLRQLAGAFDGPGALIDPDTAKVTARCRIPGTWNRKGPSGPERPHRQVRIVHAPGALEPIPLDLLRAEAGLREEPAPRPSANGAAFRGHAPYSGRAAAWLKSAVDGECGRILLAPPAKHNAAINTAAFKLGQLVGGGVLSEAEVIARLTEAATPRAPEAEARSSIRSGLEAGKLQPRGVPEGSRPAPAAPPPPPEGVAVIVWASSIPPRPVEWLWPCRVPLGKLTTFAGQTGQGKTFVTCDIIARLTRGEPWPYLGGECCDPGTALFISGDDDADDTIIPRLIELGADLGRVAFLTEEVQENWTMMALQTLDRALEGMLADGRPAPRLVVIDPPTSYLQGVDDHKNAELRAVLTPLKHWAARRRVAVILITHVNKSGGAKVEAMARVMGSVAWITGVRCAHMFVADPEDGTRQMFIPLKSNLGPKGKGLAYRIVGTPACAKIEWLGEVDLTADEAMNKERGLPRRVVASQWLIERFGEKREWPSDELFRAAAQEGISRNAIFEAKEKLQLPRARRYVAPDGSLTYVWWVPEDWPLLTRPTDPPTGTAGQRDSRDEEVI
jgi:putative DNA primase/helicase